ncbi:MAG: PrgI family protein [Candidatus Uhrbacteria bacterium]
MDKFMVPQFIDVEDKIFGPITTRQFIILLLGCGVGFVFYKVFSFWIFVLFGVILLGFCGTLAFLRVNGMPFHFFLLNIIQTFRRPHLRVWDKTYTDSELRDFLQQRVEAPPPALPQKEPISTTKLQELSLIVNTGGVYNPDEQR